MVSLLHFDTVSVGMLKRGRWGGGGGGSVSNKALSKSFSLGLCYGQQHRGIPINVAARFVVGGCPDPPGTNPCCAAGMMARIMVSIQGGGGWIKLSGMTLMNIPLSVRRGTFTGSHPNRTEAPIHLDQAPPMF